ncbi:pantoate--beta-alanine ligase [Spongiimicrobium salis]|uniref:pantoate--beta-alanine ligase n=1 Tax=Spongiimicrobium salis TaxID=1667022 RepID=UPI00374D131E
MHVFKTKNELNSYITSNNFRANNIGLVPTMGALHKGHLSLVKQAIAENDIAIVSIFINPTQFNNAEDLKKYPKPLERDLSLLSTISDRIVVFTPSVNEIYANNIQSKSYDFGGLEDVMEGEFREGHFDGVGTIVQELFAITKPGKAYFGEKDFQQLMIIKKMVSLEHIPVEIVGCPIVREESGLAMSSRNERLSPALRQEASFIYKTLKVAQEKFSSASIQDTLDWVKNQFNAHPDLDLEYIQIADIDTLKPAEKKKEHTKYRAFIAVYADSVRLIDNIALN